MSEPPTEPLVLIVDDDRTLCRLVEAWLTKAGYRTAIHHDGESAQAALTHILPDAVCLDLHLPGLSGLDTLESIKSHHPKLPVLILTSDTQVDTIVAAMRQGAYDYLPKPIHRTDLTNRLQHAVDSYRMSLRLTQLEREVQGHGYPGIVGNSAPMKTLFSHMDRLAQSDITVLIQGESGSGKELVAQAIHQQSSRRSGPFVPVNCAAIPETLQESELFGHEKGSFTGATARRAGKFELADRGTLFLDEIAELSLPAQAKLLRVLQERRFSRVGAAREQSSDFRLIAATHRSLSERVENGLFREDLYFRVAVFELDVPPLRERPEDVPLLCRHFLHQMARHENHSVGMASDQTMRALCSYDWPGNVRELQNALQRAALLSDGGALETRHLPPRILDSIEQAGGPRMDALSPVSASNHLESQAGGEHLGVTVPANATDQLVGGQVGGLDGGQGLEVAAVSGASISGSINSRNINSSTEPGPGDRHEIRTLEETEREAIRVALDQLGGNLSRVCRELGIGRTTLYRKLKKYELR